jgi:hypothetical protein
METYSDIEKIILNVISQEHCGSTTFEQLVAEFEKKLLNFNPIENCFDIESYFGKGIGKVWATHKLLSDEKINKKWFNNSEINDFKGIYVFINNATPFYVGISRCVINRIFQHLRGNNHYTSTLAFNIGKIKYEINNNKKYPGKRKDFDFAKEVEPIKAFLMKQKIAFLPIENDEELYLFEIYMAMKLKTKFNNFKTH